MQSYIVLFLLAVMLGMIIGMITEKHRSAKEYWNKFDDYAYAMEALDRNVPQVKHLTVNLWRIYCDKEVWGFTEFETDLLKRMQKLGVVFTWAVKK